MRLPTMLLLLLFAAPAAAQEREIRDANLPRRLEEQLLRMYGGGARAVTDSMTVPPGVVIHEDLAVTTGPLVVAGRVEGDVAMLNGDVVVERGGTITGRLVVVGGEVRMEEGAEVGGTITAYGDASAGGWYGDRDRGRAGLTVRADAGYNRVEGLPVMFGAEVETAGRNPLRLEALWIWRSEEVGAREDGSGYRVELEQFLGGGRRWSVGGSIFSEVDPMDRWQVSDVEASLASVLFHDDYRDYVDRTGWSAFATARPVREVEAKLAYREEEYASLPAEDPWSLFHGDEPWRDQPLVAEGTLRLLAGSLEVDLTDDRDDPYEGWFGRVSVERPVGGGLERPALVALDPDGSGVPDPSTPVPAAAYPNDFTAGLIDVRRYSPVGRHSQLDLRVVAGGALAAEPLPPQLQHALGGPGTLPGYDLFDGDCGARRVVGGLDGDPFHPSYGCDRFVLGQVEYRGHLSLDVGAGGGDRDDWWDDIHIDLEPAWVLFFDVGRGWAYGADPALDLDRTTGTLYDAGVGLVLDRLGVYMAVPLSDGVDREPRFLVRLDRRF